MNSWSTVDDGAGADRFLMPAGRPSVADYMTAAPHGIGPQETLDTARRRMQYFKVRHLPVRSGGRVVGIITERDLYVLSAFPVIDFKKAKVGFAMTPDPYMVPADAPLAEVAAEMANRRIGSALVVDSHGRLLGIFTDTDGLTVTAKLCRESMSMPRPCGVFEALRLRHAVRSFEKRPVPRAWLHRLIELATLAPSAANRQPWAFVIVTDRAILQRVARLAQTAWIAEGFEERSGLEASADVFHGAPAVVVVCATSPDPEDAGDCCLAAENFMLAAVGMGLATCPVGMARAALKCSEIKSLLHIPPIYDPVLPIAVGFGRPGAGGAPRRSPEIVYEDLIDQSE